MVGREEDGGRGKEDNNQWSRTRNPMKSYKEERQPRYNEDVRVAKVIRYI